MAAAYLGVFINDKCEALLITVMLRAHVTSSYFTIEIHFHVLFKFLCST